MKIKLVASREIYSCIAETRLIKREFWEKGGYFLIVDDIYSMQEDFFYKR